MKRNRYTDIAWECLRRNSKYIHDWENIISSTRTENVITAHTEKKEVCQSSLDVLAEKKWGLLKYIDPHISDPQHVFWSPCVSQRSLKVTLDNTGRFSKGCSWGEILSSPGISYQKLLTFDNMLCVKIFNQRDYFQLFLENVTDFDESAVIHFYFPFDMNIGVFLRSVELFKSIFNNKQISKDKEHEYLNILKTIDARKQGFSHREMALEIFGEDVVNKEWSSDSWVRAKIRYRIKKAKELIEGGYMSFL